MAGPTHGKDTVIYLDGLDFSGEARSFSISANAQAAEKTGLGGDGWRSFKAGLKGWDGDIGALYYEGAADDVKEALADVQNTRRGCWMFGIHGDEIARIAGYAEFAFVRDAALASTLEDLTELTAPLVGSGRMQWGKVQQIKTSIESFPHVGTYVDHGSGPTATGGTGFLQVFSITGGTNITAKIRDSATSGGVYADLVNFAVMVQATAPASEVVRLGATDSVEQFTKFELAEAGGVSAVVLSAGFVRGQS